MDRLVLSDAAWERMAPLIIGRPDQKGLAWTANLVEFDPHLTFAWRQDRPNRSNFAS
jgi:hypothetical protein